MNETKQTTASKILDFVKKIFIKIQYDKLYYYQLTFLFMILVNGGLSFYITHIINIPPEENIFLKWLAIISVLVIILFFTLACIASILIPFFFRQEVKVWHLVPFIIISGGLAFLEAV